MAKGILIDHVFKVFGDEPEQALELVRQGLSKKEILANKDRQRRQTGNDGPSVTYHLKNKMTVPSRRARTPATASGCPS